jgi:hypothetical protein
MMSKSGIKFFLAAGCLLILTNGFSQRYLAELDSSLFIRDTIRPFLKKFENLRFTGYIQPQFQIASDTGAKSYAGGDFSPLSSSRFMLRRARIRIDYLVPDSNNKWAKALFAFQLDATERGVNVRDMFLRLYENKNHLFSITTGLFARPFGYEINLSSSFRETPERGRMSQILMPTERDLGAMLSFEPQNRKHKWGFLKIDAGIFNGQGLSGTTDFDNHKDFIGKVTIKPVSRGRWELGGGGSALLGGWRQGSKYVYRVGETPTGLHRFNVDSSETNIGKVNPRQYYGADLQVKFEHDWGATEWRAEYWWGKQPGTAESSGNPGTLPMQPIYRRNFNGAFFYFLQNIINPKHQLVFKYDWYDPNVKVDDEEIGTVNGNFSAADIAFSTFGVGYTYYMNNHVKAILYYDLVKNKATRLAGYTEDLDDNILTCRLQFIF